MNRNVALVYVRVSRLDEDERARKVSPEMQREKALVSRELEGLKVETFEDLDISGKAATNRPQYQALLQRLEAGDVRYVVRTTNRGSPEAWPTSSASVTPLRSTGLCSLRHRPVV